MIEELKDLPDGVLGFRFAGSVTREDYRDVFRPPVTAALASGAPVRLVLVMEDDAGWFQPGAMWEDLKLGVGSGVPHHSAWERMAIVSDAGWVGHAMGLFGWMVPGEARVFGKQDLDGARAWVTR
ncbi:STAS/SEC14 domain-containing protein [Actinoplanes sp. NPDC051861]|uniref:STAS/SEC14 domain-containing protein n=1 Tax=Actinoplanes sp. NPDC051861 TaxID=3155170 RepID=UPI003412686D